MDEKYFQTLQHDLKRCGQGMPQLILDQAAFLHNLQIIKSLLKDQIHPRLVVKSLANLSLLKIVSTTLKTKRFMVFHFPQLHSVLEEFPEANILLGKPMPIAAVKQFYEQYPQFKAANIQWLIDTPQRLQQYYDLARQQQIKLKLSIEIDVGLHRGGINTQEDFLLVLKMLVQHPECLRFSGLMGYDAHVAKVPKIIKKQKEAFAESQDIYKFYQELILKHYPELWHEHLCFNGGGSPTLPLHAHKSVCNDVAFGSVLLKPSDFDLEHLGDFKPALWLATPVLKMLNQLQIPALELLSQLPIKQQAIFIYGGYWLADYVYPIGLKPHPLYGRSSNQEMLTVPNQTKINVDDYVIARPQQSEVVLTQFAELYFYEQHQFMGFPNLRE